MKYLGLILCICSFAATAQALEVLIDEPSATVETSIETEEDVLETAETTEPAEKPVSVIDENESDNILEAADVAAIDELIQSGFNVNSRDENGFTPLVYVLQNNQDLAVAQRMIDVGADINAPCLNGITPLLVAVSVAGELDADYRQILAQTGVEETPEQKENFERVSAQQMQRALEMLKMLIAAGADFNQETPRGTPLMVAATNSKNTRLIAELLQAGANINQTDQKGRTALFYAHAFGLEETETQLIRAGALVDIKDRTGNLYMDAVKEDFLPHEEQIEE